MVFGHGVVVRGVGTNTRVAFLFARLVLEVQEIEEEYRNFS